MCDCLNNPAHPCCNANVLCKRWPKIDWSAFTWLVRTPDAAHLRRDAVNGRRSGLLDRNTWNSTDSNVIGWTAHDDESAVGLQMITGGDTIFGPSGYWFRGGEFLAQHNGGCSWLTYNREELIYRNLALFRVELSEVRPGPFATAFWFVPASDVLTADQLAEWDSRTIDLPVVGFTFEGVPYESGQSQISNELLYIGVRDLLPQLTCIFLPALEARTDIVAKVDLQDLSQPPGVLSIIDDFRSRDSATWPNNGFLYKPTALELAASFMLRRGFLFGIVDDIRSPLHGQFTCFEGASYSQDGDANPFLQSTPWESISGEIRAELGVVNRLERTNDTGSLPEWIELELVRI